MANHDQHQRLLAQARQQALSYHLDNQSLQETITDQDAEIDQLRQTVGIQQLTIEQLQTRIDRLEYQRQQEQQLLSPAALQQISNELRNYRAEIQRRRAARSHYNESADRQRMRSDDHQNRTFSPTHAPGNSVDFRDPRRPISSTLPSYPGSPLTPSGQPRTPAAQSDSGASSHTRSSRSDPFDLEDRYPEQQNHRSGSSRGGGG